MRATSNVWTGGLAASVTFAALGLLPNVSSPVSGQAPSTQAPHIGEGGVPQFQKDPGWPKIPARYKMGFGSAVTGDSEGNVWVLSRPHTLANPRSTAADTRSVPAPPVMEFDQAGNFIQGWGGESGPGYQWPSNEHGLTVDSRGFVWVLGNADGKSNNPANLPNDNQVLKFTKAGKFVMAIGKSGQTGSNKTEVLKGATGLYYYAKTNELFVSDGYGNNRIIVYDGDTGGFKRMWGAYGNKPLDMEDRPARSKLVPDPWVAVSEVLKQFASPVHDVKVSDDGLVYVADRGNKRVQVFTPAGQFVAEQFVGVDSKYGLQARGLAFSPDQRFLYVGGTPVVYILNRRTLEILGAFKTGEGDQSHPPGHQIGTDNKGNVYVVQAELTGADGHDGQAGGTGAYKWAFKGYSPAVRCCSGGAYHAAE
jgi:DNA-binding beta-propeller fold protein YncE